MVKEFNSLEEIQKYYNKETNTYVFKENGCYIQSIVFNFDLYVEANIDAIDIRAFDIETLDIKVRDINARDINARDIVARDISACNIEAGDISANNIDACDINAWNIDACYISYWAVCFAYNSIKCKSIKSERKNNKHFVLDGKLEVEEDE